MVGQGAGAAKVARDGDSASSLEGDKGEALDGDEGEAATASGSFSRIAGEVADARGLPLGVTLAPTDESNPAPMEFTGGVPRADEYNGLSSGTEALDTALPLGRCGVSFLDWCSAGVSIIDL
jgi:hypothetical protein